MLRQVKERAGRGQVISSNPPRKAPGGDSEVADRAREGAGGLTPTRFQVGARSTLTPRGSACSVTGMPSTPGFS